MGNVSASGPRPTQTLGSAFGRPRLGLNKAKPSVRDCHRAALAARAELDDAVAQREDRVVAADAGSGAWAELRAALAHDDRAGRHLLAGEDLHAEHLRIGVAPVARRAETLLVCHLGL